MRGRSILAISFLALTAGYALFFAVQTSTEPEAAWSRFEALKTAGWNGRAAGHGDKALKLWGSEGLSGPRLHQVRLEVADAHYFGGERKRAIETYAAALSSREARAMPDAARTEINRRIAELELAEGQVARPALIAARFLERAGDAVAGHEHDRDANTQERFLFLVDAMRKGFTDALPSDGSGLSLDGDERTILSVAEAMTTLGGYYALEAEGAYAAAGLLSVAHDLRARHLGPDHEDTVQTALLLAPAYERIDRLSEAESLYEQIFHAQERARGANSPELSLYIRLLSGVYEKQGRLTEAEALNRHMRQIFRDAFGARRYAANRSRDRLFDINRPVSPAFPLEASYTPPDLVAAGDHGVPLSKPAHLEEMHLRVAKIDGTTLPEALGGLLEECGSAEERLTLRSAYRSHKTQKLLFAINKDKGTVAEPGTSEHQTGLAVDIDVNRRFMRATDRAYACFEKKAFEYGFILSFPPENSYLPGEDSYEPWHWRFVGPRTALLYREIGPWGRPQEFLSSLPCYEERAMSGLFVDRERGDICLERIKTAESRENGRDT